MAKNKDSFILYVDQIHAFEALSDEEAGKLIKLIFRYVNDKNPEIPDRLTGIAFEPIKRQLKRDLVKWKKTRKGRSDAGKKGMKKRWSTDNKTYQSITNDNPVINDITKITVTENVNVNDNVTVNVNERENTAALSLKNGLEILYTIEHCAEVAMKDARFVKANKTNIRELHDFNNMLEKRAVYNKNPADYKNHFANWKMGGKKDEPAGLQQNPTGVPLPKL